MKLYYWSPFFSNIATEKAVINSIYSIKKYSKETIKPYLLEVIGEWKNQKNEIKKKKIEVKKFYDFNLINYLPKFGYIQSRFSYIIVFLFSIIKLHKILRNEKPDFLVIHLMTFIPLLLLFLFKYETKFILRISGYPKLNYIRSFFWKVVGKNIFIITTPTKNTKNLLVEKKIFHPEKIKYLPDPILNIKSIQKKKRENNFIEKEISSDKTLVSIGRLSNQKNFIFLIKAFHNLQKKRPNLNLLIIGDGENKKKLKDQIQRLNLNDKVFLLGFKKNIYDYLKNSKMFILPSLWEDPGFVLVEAGYMNLTILSSDCPNGPKELLNNQKNGFLFKTNSFADFIENFEVIENLDKKIIEEKKLSFKKKIKEFTLLGHFKILRSILLSNEN